MVLIPKTADIDEQIKEQYKEEAKFFQDYDCPPQWSTQPIASKEQNLDPFKKVNWKNIFDENFKENYRIKKVDGKLVWAYFIKENKESIVFKPNDGPQTDFLAAGEQDVLYGGAAGGGKSYAMLVDPLRFMHRPSHRALLLRRSMPELRELIDKSKELYTKAFPSGKF